MNDNTVASTGSEEPKHYNKSCGESLLFKYLLHGDLELFQKATFTNEHFVGLESPMFEFITNHIQHEGSLPSPATFEYHFCPVQNPPENLNYYLKKVLARWQYRTLQLGLDNIAKSMNNKDMPSAFATLQELQSVVTKGAYHTPLFTIDKLQMKWFLENKAPKVEMLIEGIMQRKQVNLFGGQPGTGKSRLTLQLAMSVACGAPFCGSWAVNYTGKVLMVTCEDDTESLHRRIEAAASSYTQEQKVKIAENLIAQSMVGRDMRLTEMVDGIIKPSAIYGGLRALIAGIPDLELVILDPVSMLNGSGENGATEMTVLYNLFSAIKEDFGVTVVIAAHVNKAATSRDAEASMDDLRGSSAAAAAVRWVGILYKMRKKEALEHSITMERMGYFTKLVIVKFTEAPPSLLFRDLWLELNDEGVFQFKNMDLPSVKPNMMMQIGQDIFDAASKGIYFTKTKYINQFAGVEGKYGLGVPALKEKIQDCIAANILIEIQPPVKMPGAITVLAAGSAITQPYSDDDDLLSTNQNP